MTYEKVTPANTHDEMRAEIFRLSHYDSLVRACMTSADVRGTRAEDRYVELAYHALKERAKLGEMCLDFVNVHPMKSGTVEGLRIKP